MLLGQQSSKVLAFRRTSVMIELVRGSISKVMADDRLGISGSYDATIILWDLGSKNLS